MLYLLQHDMAFLLNEGNFIFKFMTREQILKNYSIKSKSCFINTTSIRKSRSILHLILLLRSFQMCLLDNLNFLQLLLHSLGETYTPFQKKYSKHICDHESLVEIHDSSMCLVGMPFAKGVPCLLGCLNVVEHGDHILINR